MGFKKEINDSSAITNKKSKLNYGRVKFDIKLAQATADNGFVYEAYKLIRKTLLNYKLHSRISSSGESFRLHRKRFAKITISGKRLKIYLAVLPSKLKSISVPFTDVSNKKSYSDIPIAIKVHSHLAVRRTCKVIEAMMAPYVVKPTASLPVNPPTSNQKKHVKEN